MDARGSLITPKLFSMAHSRALLESRRLNASYTEQPSALDKSTRIDPAQSQLRLPSQAAPRVSLTALLSNSGPPRTSTPVIFKPSGLLYNQYGREEGTENGASSPVFTSYESPDRAYIQLNRPPSISPNAQRTFRLSSLQGPSQTSRKPANENVHARSSAPASELNENMKIYDRFMLYLSSTDSQNQQLTSQNEHLDAMNAQLSRELEDSRSRLNTVTTQLDSANLELRATRPALTSAREQLATKKADLASVKSLLSETKAELCTVLAERKSVKEEHTQEMLENERLRTNVDTAKRSIAKLLIEYATMGENFRELKKAYDSSQALYDKVLKEAEETKKFATSGLSALKPLLDDNNTLTRAAETKAVLKELQSDLSDSQQVTDLLRNKLHHQSSQLADAQGRIRELEEEKRGSMQELLRARQDEKRQFDLLMVVEGQIAELSERLSARERETIDTLANGASNEAELKAAITEIDFYKKNCEAQTLELETLRIMKEENVSRLLALQDVINARDKEIISLKADVKALNESKSELRALLAENKRNLAEKEVELRAKDPNDDFLVKIRSLEAECISLKSALQESQEQCITYENLSKHLEREQGQKLHEAEKSNVELLSCNRMLKESLAKIQDEFKAASLLNGKCVILERELEKARADSKRTCDGLLAEIAEMKGRLEVQSVSLFQSKEDCALLKERVGAAREQQTVLQAAVSKQQHDGAILSKAQEKRASAAEHTAALAQTQVADATRSLHEMESRVASLTRELVTMQEAATVVQNSTALETDERVQRLEKMAAELERRNDQLSKHANEISTRYEHGKLTDIEKEFVRYLMGEAESIHEEGVVKKDNELRRREHTIRALNSKVAELQTIVARLLKEKGGQPGAVNKSIIDFKAWLSSSPDRTPEDDMEVPPESPLREALLPDNSMLNIADPTSISHSDSKLSVPANLANPKVAQFHNLDADSDDDIPLSELSRLPSSDREGEEGQRTGTKRLRSPSPPAADEPSHSKRRTRNSTGPKAGNATIKVPPLQTKTAEGNAKSKQKKRK
ncbi:hypothetical protein BDZ97DRAFT_1824897 [Flammula alnicola]|nr:hypothetical protein BDZ97DRAFT_1824897 [Flammula alnicola]